jgi:hypothetical protein
VLSSHSSSRRLVVPQPTTSKGTTDAEKPARKSRYIPWAELLQRTFGFEIVCQKCQCPLRLIALIKNQDIAKKILTAMHLPTELGPTRPAPAPRGFAAPVAQLHPARPPPRQAGGGEDFVN